MPLQCSSLCHSCLEIALHCFTSRECPGPLPCPTSESFSRLQLWCVPKVGPASDLGLGSVPPSGRSRLQFQLRFQTPYQLKSPRQSLRSLRDSGGTRRGWDPGPRHQCLSGDLGGPDPPSGPVLKALVSHPHPDLSHLQSRQQQRQHPRLSYRLPPGSGGRYSSGTLFRGTSRFIRETSMGSHSTTSRH